jgi:hypothetical protein
MNEIWKPIKEFEKYYLMSNLNNIWSIRKKKLMKTQIDDSGYLTIVLNANHIKYKKYIHILKAEIWIPNPLNLPEVNHIDGNKQNCDISNLEWCTRQYNVIHAHKTGLMNPVHGENINSAKLTEQQVIEIRNMKGKMKGNKIAKIYNVDNHTIYDIFHNVTWKHLL